MPSIKDYRIGALLGRGSFGRVIKLKYLRDGQQFAAKEMKKAKCSRESFEREVGCLEKARAHESIITIIEHFETDISYYIVMNLCDKTLHTVVNKRRHRKLSEGEACHYMKQVFSGVAFLHSLPLFHRDIKTENIGLLGENVQILDFGLATTSSDWLSGKVGTVCYRSPQVEMYKKYKGDKADVYSSAVMFFEIVCGHQPFTDRNFKAIRQQTMNVPIDTNMELVSLMKEGLLFNPDSRPSASGFLEKLNKIAIEPFNRRARGYFHRTTKDTKTENPPTSVHNTHNGSTSTEYRPFGEAIPKNGFKSLKKYLEKIAEEKGCEVPNLVGNMSRQETYKARVILEKSIGNGRRIPEHDTEDYIFRCINAMKSAKRRQERR